MCDLEMFEWVYHQAREEIVEDDPSLHSHQNNVQKVSSVCSLSGLLEVLPFFATSHFQQRL